MRLHLGPDAVAAPTEHNLSCTPRLALDIPAVSTHLAADRCAHERLLRETFGSVDWLWSGDDEFRFKKKDKSIVSLTLRIPEDGLLPAGDPHKWLAAPTKPGGLRVFTEENFSVPPATTRWVSEEADWLACSLHPTPVRETSIKRLRVANDLDLVFEDDVYAGWVLENPANYLTRGIAVSPKEPAPTPLRLAFRDYMSFFVQSTYDLMAEEDAGALKELEALLARTVNLPEDPRQKALVDQIEDQRERWYGH